MQMMRPLVRIAALMVLALSVSAAGNATTYSWVFADATHQGNVGSSKTFDSSPTGKSLGTTGWVATNLGPGNAALGTSWTTGGTSSADLYEKYSGVGSVETGLGMNVDAGADHEIDPKHFIQLDIKGLRDQGLSHLVIDIGSAQTGEGYYIWGSSTSGAPGQLLLSGFGDAGAKATVTISDSIFSTYDFLSISANPGVPANGAANILVMNGIHADSVPELGTSVGFACLCLPLVSLLRRRMKRSPAEE